MSNSLPAELFIPYARQWIDKHDVAAVVNVLADDWLTTGPCVEAFETALTQVTGAKEAVVLSSGTAALHAAYAAIGLGEGDEIITSPMTFVSTANAALFLGAEVRFVDIDPATGTIDPAAIEDVVTERTRAITGVDYAGHPADYDAIREVARRHDLTVIADASHSLGATSGGRDVGTLADLTTLSFHPVKPITTGEGGAVLTDDAEQARRMTEFRAHGITRNQARMEKFDGPWDYEMQSLGHNYRITDLQCALGGSQIRRLDAFVNRRRGIAARYLEKFSGIEELILPAVDDAVESGWHLFVVRLREKPERREAFFSRLQQLNLGVQVHYRPVYLHPYYRRLGYQAGLCPRAEDFYRRAVSLPLFPAMNEAEVDTVIHRVHQAVEDTLR